MKFELCSVELLDEVVINEQLSPRADVDWFGRAPFIALDRKRRGRRQSQQGRRSHPITPRLHDLFSLQNQLDRIRCDRFRGVGRRAHVP